MTVEVPSAATASFAERARGVPSVIQWGAIGASVSSTSAAQAKTTGLDTAPLQQDQWAIRRGSAKQSVNAARRSARGCCRNALQGQTVEDFALLAGYAIGSLPRGGRRPVAPSPPQRGRQRAPLRLAA